MKKKPGMIAHVCFVIVVAAWVVTFKLVVAPMFGSTDGHGYNLTQTLVAAFGGLLLAPLGLGFGLMVERALDKEKGDGT